MVKEDGHKWYEKVDLAFVYISAKLLFILKDPCPLDWNKGNRAAEKIYMWHKFCGIRCQKLIPGSSTCIYLADAGTFQFPYRRDEEELPEIRFKTTSKGIDQWEKRWIQSGPIR